MYMYHMLFVAMETILVGYYEFRTYQNVCTCTYKLGWCSVNTLARMLNHTEGR